MRGCLVVIAIMVAIPLFLLGLCLSGSGNNTDKFVAIASYLGGAAIVVFALFGFRGKKENVETPHPALPSDSDAKKPD